LEFWLFTLYDKNELSDLSKKDRATLEGLLSVAGAKPTDSGAKPNSYVPHPHTNHHVYGAPIQPAIVGHAKTSHHKHAPKKRSSSAANRDAQ